MNVETSSTGRPPCKASKRRSSARPRSGPFWGTWTRPAIPPGIVSRFSVDECRPPRQRHRVADLGHGYGCRRPGRRGRSTWRIGRARGRPGAAPFRCTRTSTWRSSPCRPRAETRRARSNRCSSRSAAACCRRRRCACGSIGSLHRCTWMAARRTRGAGLSLLARRARSPRSGGDLRDVQELAGHTSLAMTQRYIEGDTEAKRKLVALL
jgi:hypothetical protein